MSWWSLKLVELVKKIHDIINTEKCNEQFVVPASSSSLTNIRSLVFAKMFSIPTLKNNKNDFWGNLQSLLRNVWPAAPSQKRSLLSLSTKAKSQGKENAKFTVEPRAWQRGQNYIALDLPRTCSRQYVGSGTALRMYFLLNFMKSLNNWSHSVECV